MKIYLYLPYRDLQKWDAWKSRHLLPGGIIVEFLYFCKTSDGGNMVSTYFLNDQNLNILIFLPKCKKKKS